MTLMNLNNRPAARNYDALFNDFFNFPLSNGTSTRSGVPANIFETENAYHLELNVPGRNKEDFNVSVDKNLLTITYENKEEKEVKDQKFVRREFRFENFTRSFSIDENINAENIEAKYENGLLKFTLPKAEIKKPQVKTIAIQ